MPNFHLIATSNSSIGETSLTLMNRRSNSNEQRSRGRFKILAAFWQGLESSTIEHKRDDDHDKYDRANDVVVIV